MPDLIVLCYHALSPGWGAALSTTPARFERQMALLASRGYRAVTFSEAVALGGRGRYVAITFDDAYTSVFERARPILDRHGFVATVFAPTDWIGTGSPMSWQGIEHWHGGPFEQELVPLDWERLRELAATGWEIGSHTLTHPHLPALADEELARELSASKAACEAGMGRPCSSLAYPYGDVDDRCAAAARAAGYTAAAALPRRLASRDPLRWPRLGIYCADDDRRFRMKISRLMRAARASWLWPDDEGAAQGA